MSKKDKGAAKTNAVRLLEKAGVTFETKEYPVDEEHLDARHVADGVGEDISLVFKTLVLKGERTGLFVCVIPGAEEVDLKKAARAAGDKKAEMLPMKELLPATGYIRGGCSPVGMQHPQPTFCHVPALHHPKTHVSAGQRGRQLIIAPQDLINFVGGTAVDLIKD